MLKPEKMVKVSVVGPKDQFTVVADVLHRIHLLHIEDPAEEEYFQIGEPLEKASLISRSLVQLRSYISYLKIDPTRIIPRRKYRVEEIREQLSQKLEEYQEEIGRKIEENKEIDEKLRSLDEELRLIEPLKALGIPASLLKGYRTIRTFVGFIKEDPTQRLREITSEFEIFRAEYEKELIIAVFVKVEYAEEFFRVLQEAGYREIPVPDVEDYDARISEIEREKEKLVNRKKHLETEIEEIKVKEAETLLAIEEYLSTELDKSELPLKSLVSKYTFVIIGYVPAKAYNNFKKELETKGNFVVEKINEEGEPPTKLRNPPIAKDFELLTTTYATPKYREIDPSIIMAIFFPLFFGMMLGDMGYGLLITVIALYLKKVFKTEGWQKLLNIALYSGIVSIIFGFIYGECFGPYLVGEIPPSKTHFLGDFLYNLYAFNHHHPLFDRVEPFGVKALLFVTLAIGMFKLLWGFALGFRNVAVEHGIGEAILEKGCWFVGVLGLSLIILGFTYNLGIFTTEPHEGFGVLLPDNLYVFGSYTVEQAKNVPLPIPGMVKGWQVGVNVFYLAALPLLLLWFVIFLKAEIPKMGAMGVIMGVELLTWFGQILSYARLLAIGLSSVYFAYVFNYLGLKLGLPPGTAILPVAAIVIILGHTVNLILGILDPGLQSLRLHYVEFFTKFFEGGGRAYSPFGRIKRFLED
jgi:V/A-type H+-transporting ATPase subunit I